MMKRGILTAMLVMLAGQVGLAQQAVQKSEAKSQIPGTLVAEKDDDLNDVRSDMLQAEPSKAKNKGALNPVGQNSTPAATAAAGKSKWSGSIELRNEFVAATVIGKTGGISVNDTYIVNRLNYDLTSNLRATAGFDINHNLFGTNKSAEQRTVDTYDDAPFVALTVPKVATLPADINLSIAARVYAPTAGVMQDGGYVASRVYGFLTKDIGRFSLAYIANPREYFNSKSSVNYVNPDNTSAFYPTTAFRMVQIFEVDYKLSDLFAVYQQIGVDDVFNNTASVNGVALPGSGSQVTNEILETAVNFTPNATYRVTSGVSTYEHNYRTQGFTLYGPETRYFVSGAASF